MSTVDINSFGKWRSRLWPIHSFELKKMLPLFLLKFLASLIYSILTCMKDTLVVTADNSGAEVIPVLKGWVVLPCAILATVIFVKLSNVLKKSTLFYGIIAFFLAVITIYGFVLYPNIEFFSPHESADLLLSKVGQNFSHWIAIYRNWIHSLFFVTSELWAQVVIMILFWGFVNQIVLFSEAKRCYTLFIAAGDVGSLLAGPLVLFFAKRYAHLDFSHTLQMLILFIVLFGGLLMGVYWWINRYVLPDRRFYDPDKMGHTIKKKTKLSLLKSIKFIASSKYLLHLAIIVIGCGLTINMIEVTWKANLKLLYPDPADYQSFMGVVVSSVGFFALITILFFGGTALRRFGWLFSARLTPILVGATGLLFFLFSHFQDSIHPLTSLFGITPLVLVVFFGAFQNVLSKVMKYSFFDSTKEMAFIPLDHESKVKGKAAIDVVGSRLGKSGSSWIQLAFIEFLGAGSVLNITSYLIPLVTIMVIFWVYSVSAINKKLVPESVTPGVLNT